MGKAKPPPAIAAFSKPLARLAAHLNPVAIEVKAVHEFRGMRPHPP